MKYIHERKNWTKFSWDEQKILPILADVHYKEGVLFGKMSAMGAQSRDEAMLNAVSAELQKSYEIEGERLDISKVRSSFAARLNISITDKTYSTKEIERYVDIMLDAIQNYSLSLTRKRLFDWHRNMFVGNRSGLYKISSGKYRTTDMQVVSGSFGREWVHFKAPEASRVPEEMQRFLDFVNVDETYDPIIKAIVAHLWFVTIHPFDDGNGRLTRVITEMLLARGRDSSYRLYSVSSQIMKERNSYYEILESTQKGDGDITRWLLWFLHCIEKSIDAAERSMSDVFAKAAFWQKHADTALNSRQRKMINMLMSGFEGKLTSSKWAKITKCSADTALRDISDLTKKKILAQDECGGKNTGYVFCLEA